jgi:uncharacterized membrane protein YfcA
VIEVAGILTLGFAAGMTAGLFGVGGGVLAVVALTVVLGLEQHEAQATSLLAVIPVTLVGAWRQHRYGNLRLHDGALLGVLSIGGALAGVVVANAVSGRTLEVAFACLILFVAYRLVRRAWSLPEVAEPGVGEGPPGLSQRRH